MFVVNSPKKKTLEEKAASSAVQPVNMTPSEPDFEGFETTASDIVENNKQRMRKHFDRKLNRIEEALTETNLTDQSFLKCFAARLTGLMTEYETWHFKNINSSSPDEFEREEDEFRSASEYESDTEFDSDSSGESTAPLEDSGHDNIRDELSGESDHFKRGIEIISTRSDSKYRYYHAGVWRLDVMAGPEELFSCIQKANRDIRLLYVFLERDHLHVVHDCAYSNSSCRCFCVKTLRRKCKRRQFRELASKEIDAIVNYYFAVDKICIFGKMRIDQHPDYNDRVLYNGSVKNSLKSFVELGQYVALPKPIDKDAPGHEYSESEQSVETMDPSCSSLFEHLETNEGTSRRKRSWNSEVHGGLMEEVHGGGDREKSDILRGFD